MNVVVVGTLPNGFSFTLSFKCKDLKEIESEENAKWYLDNKYVENIYVSMKGEKYEKN